MSDVDEVYKNPAVKRKARGDAKKRHKKRTKQVCTNNLLFTYDCVCHCTLNRPLQAFFLNMVLFLDYLFRIQTRFCLPSDDKIVAWLFL